MSYQCRICLEEDDKQKLVAPCDCNGTSKYIHPKCLTSWREQNINTPYFNTCIDCRQEYVYEISQQEDIFISVNKISNMLLILMGITTMLLGCFDHYYSIQVFESIKNKNITEILDMSNYYFIFYYMIISNYLLNCVLFVFTWYVFTKVINKKKYLAKMYPHKLKLFFNTWYIYVFYVLFKFNIFLVVSSIFLCVNCYYGYSFFIYHNTILKIINCNNIEYRKDYNNNYEESNEPLAIISSDELIETIEEDIERNAQYENENLRVELL
jgi:hypothetical protein